MRGGSPALFVISIPAAPPSNMRLLFRTGKLAVLISTPVNEKRERKLVNNISEGARLIREESLGNEDM